MKCENGPCENEAVVLFVDMTRPSFNYNICHEHFICLRDLYEEKNLLFFTKPPKREKA